MTDTYVIWKLISLVNFIYIAFISKGQIGHLAKVYTIYTNIYLQAFKDQSTNNTFHNNIVPKFELLDSTTFVLCHLIYLFEKEFNIEHI